MRFHPGFDSCRSAALVLGSSVEGPAGRGPHVALKDLNASSRAIGIHNVHQCFAQLQPQQQIWWISGSRPAACQWALVITPSSQRVILQSMLTTSTLELRWGEICSMDPPMSMGTLLNIALPVHPWLVVSVLWLHVVLVHRMIMVPSIFWANRCSWGNNFHSTGLILKILLLGPAVVCTLERMDVKSSRFMCLMKVGNLP
jgi:hypothetical protein